MATVTAVQPGGRFGVIDFDEEKITGVSGKTAR